MSSFSFNSIVSVRARFSAVHKIVTSPKAYLRRRRVEREEKQFYHALKERPGLKWHRSQPCRQTLYDHAVAQIGHQLFIVCGYIGLDAVSDTIDVFDLERNLWVRTIQAPRGISNSHAAVASDGERYIYVASGQLGPQCKPAVRETFSYDTQADVWRELPPVPAARYAATMQLWRGRLHFVGGAAEDRWTPKDEHWSLGVASGKAIEPEWRTEVPIPVPAMHRGSVVVNDILYVLGGQQGDFVAIDGDPDCRCTGRTEETYLASCFKLDQPSGSWKRIADMPIAASHTDFAIIQYGEQILVAGGQVYKHPEKYYLRLTDAIQAYNVQTDSWTIAGHLPYRLKIPAVGLLRQRLFMVCGQRGSKDSDFPGPISDETWWAELPAPAQLAPAVARRNYFSGKSILLLTHDLSRTGAPLLLLETAQLLIESGATVRLASAADDVNGWNLASEYKIPLIPLEAAAQIATNSDIIIANTVSKGMNSWVNGCLNSDPTISDRLIWWVHEIDVEEFQPHSGNLKKAAGVIFDSEASRAAWLESTTEIPSKSAVIHPALSEAFIEKISAAGVLFPSRPEINGLQVLEAASRSEIRERLGILPSDFLVCNIGTFSLRKGQRMLIRTLARLASEKKLPIKLVLVGFLSRKQRAKLLKDLTRQERAVLAPERAYVAQSEIAAYYKAADAFVMNSQGLDKSRGECFGRVTVEAMACGNAVLGTSEGGTREIIQDGVTGFLYPIGEAGQSVLADRIEQLIRDRDLVNSITSAGRAHALEYFRQERFLRELETAVSKLLGQVALSGAPTRLRGQVCKPVSDAAKPRQTLVGLPEDA